MSWTRRTALPLTPKLQAGTVAGPVAVLTEAVVRFGLVSTTGVQPSQGCGDPDSLISSRAVFWASSNVTARVVPSVNVTVPLVGPVVPVLATSGASVATRLSDASLLFAPLRGSQLPIWVVLP